MRKASEYGLPNTRMQIESIRNRNTYKTKQNQSDFLSFNLNTFTFTFLLCENELGHSSPELQQLVKRVH